MERSPFPMNYSQETCALIRSRIRLRLFSLDRGDGWIYRHPFGTRFKGQRRYDG